MLDSSAFVFGITALEMRASKSSHVASTSPALGGGSTRLLLTRFDGTATFFRRDMRNSLYGSEYT
jgi:hypothetical protein